jgi:hypothetical protein
MTTADDAYRTIRQAVLKDAGAGPLHGILSAVTHRAAADRVTGDWITRAREDGNDWLQIGRALGMEGPGNPPYDVAAAAYERSCGTDGLGDPLPFWFPCGSCGRMVTDRGPYVASPLDCEEGHADGCARFSEAVRAYRAQWDEEDDTDG